MWKCFLIVYLFVSWVYNRTHIHLKITLHYPGRSLFDSYWLRQPNPSYAVRSRICFGIKLFNHDFWDQLWVNNRCFLLHILFVSAQGLNFSGADLSRLDLRYINFKMANLSRCNLTYANLCCSNLERADLSGANLDVRSILYFFISSFFHLVRKTMTNKWFTI